MNTEIQPTPKLALRDLVITYDGVKAAVDAVSLDVVGPGLTVIVGPSGCGKSSLLRAVAGFETPAAGSVAIDGAVVAGAGTWVPPERRQVGMVFQHGALFPHLTVDENVRYGLHRRADRTVLAARALDLVGLSDYRDRFPDQLSGGEQQRVALARAMAPKPRLLLLDEPFASLDASLRRHLRNEVKSILDAAGATALLVTHDLEEALSLADTVVVMAAGRILQSDPPTRLYQRPASLEVARLLGDGQLVPCRVADGQARTRLGTTSCARTLPDGPGLLLVRPEDLTLTTPAEDDTGASRSGTLGRIASRTFYGHDCVDRVVLDDGEVVFTRLLASTGPDVGSRVRVHLRQRTLQVFSDPEAGAAQAIIALDSSV